MKRITCIFFLLLFFYTAFTQAVFTAIGTKGPVVEGEAFSIQFVLEESDDKNEFHPPDFKDFRFISGPFINTGTVTTTDGPKQTRNISYALEALKPGRFIIEGASAKVNGSYIKSNEIVIEVISHAEAVKKNLAEKVRAFDEPNRRFILKPEEDPYDKIKKNLFVKVSVDKKSCFIGEPIMATFKLYSTLESRSDIVKNPGFYGFTVQDMAGLEDNKISFEVLNGKRFDVHTIRVVQLYPLQAGSFTIDPMEIENKVRFSTRIINRPQQEIVEGVFTDETIIQDGKGKVYENSIHTEPIAINVKPYPQKNKPGSFNGATGHFSIEAFTDKNELIKNEEGHLVITVSGKGNFTQLTEPLVQWPAGLESFESETSDQLDVKKIPLAGKRVFKIPFVAAKAGNYTIPSISFSFFDPDTNSYKTVSTKETNIIIKSEKAGDENNEATKNNSVEINYTKLILPVAILLSLIIMGWVLWHRKAKKKIAPIAEKENSTTLTLAQIMAPVKSSLPVNDRGFYALLRSCIWNFFSNRFGLYGSGINRPNMVQAMKQRKVDEKLQQEIVTIIDQCETGIFTDVNEKTDRTELVERTTTVLEKIDSYCS